MSDLTPAALDFLATHHGVTTVSLLGDHGVGRKTQRRLIARRVLLRPRKGVLVLSSSPSTLEQRCAVLCRAHPDGFVTGPTAGQLTGLRRMPSRAPLHFAVHHGARLPPETGVHFRQTTAVQPSDRHERDDGIVVATPARLAFDLAADLRELDLLSVLHQLLHERRVTADELVAIERRLGHPARPGSGRFRRALERLDGRAANESDAEVRLSEALRELGVPVEHQTRVVRLPDGRTARIDLAVPEVRWGVEIDLHPEHRSVPGSAGDARRDRQLHLVGWQIEHVTELDMQDIRSTAAELAMLYQERRRSVASNPRVS